MPQTFSSPPKAVPLGKVAANAVSRRKGYSTAAPHFHRKQTLQMQFPATTPPVKKASVALRRVRQTRKFKIIFPLNMARAQRRPFKIVPRPAGERAQKAPPSGGAGIEQSEMPERVRAQTTPVKRQFWKIRRFSRIANLKIYFPLIMRSATRSAFKIVLCPAGERTQKMLPLAGEQIRHTTPRCTEKKGVQSQFSFLP